MKHLKLFFDLNKEENYLNQMASHGWLFTKRSIFGFYHFAKDNQQQLHYKVDYRTFQKKKDFMNYVSLFEDAGFQHIWGTQYSGHQYFLPKTKEASRDIFSDKESKAERYKRLQLNCINCFALMILYWVVDFIILDIHLSGLLFQTPGLLEMKGTEFWKAFWLEVPFVLLRILPVVILAYIAILNAFWAVKAKRLYKKIIQEEN